VLALDLNIRKNDSLTQGARGGKTSAGFMKTVSRQIIYIFGGIVISPLLPFLYWQGRRTRKKVGRLPDAGGETSGQCGENETILNLLAIGESTVAGVGAENHAEALAGQLAKFLSLETGKSVRWHVVGESGITARETLQRLVPILPRAEMDLIVVGLGGNDAFKVNSPNRWRRDMIELIEKLKEIYPNASILLTNTPMIRDFPVLPQPLKFVLWRVSRLHHDAIKTATNAMENVFYFDEPDPVDERFFADGVHPSPYGYALWSEAMIKFLLKKTNF
jgi:lysophospholipase L1-like esterase